MSTARREAEKGYALLTAVMAMALVAILCATVVQEMRGRTTLLAAEAERARLEAGADAGLVLALRQLTLIQRFRRWAPDGRPHTLAFAGMRLVATVEDERGKVPLNRLDGMRARALFAAVGVSGVAGDRLADALLDWRDADDAPRPDGAERAAYAPLGRVPRDGPLQSLDELLEVRGMTPALLGQLRPVASVVSGEGAGFDDRYAQPLAVRVMGEGEVTAAQRERELAGTAAGRALNDAETLVGRPLTIRVLASDGADGRLARAWLVQLTGTPDPPYVVRAVTDG